MEHQGPVIATIIIAAFITIIIIAASIITIIDPTSFDGQGWFTGFNRGFVSIKLATAAFGLIRGSAKRFIISIICHS